jgi:hypothetical protein
MKRTFGLTVIALFSLATSAWSSCFLCLHCGVHCMVPPPPNCPDCSCPCDHRLNLCPQWKSEHAQKLIDELQTCDCCERIHAVKKLGHRLHADFCNDPCVLEVLISSLQCDTCWEVRRAAAWGIQGQNARTEQGVLALYIASKLDPHYLVRVAATEALDILTIAHRECFTETLKQGDDLIKQLKAQGYKPGSDNCKVILGTACAGCGILHGQPAISPAPDSPAKPEPIPAPKTTPVKPASFELSPMKPLPRPTR